jgi:hypothetical protein
MTMHQTISALAAAVLLGAGSLDGQSVDDMPRSAVAVEVEPLPVSPPTLHVPEQSQIVRVVNESQSPLSVRLKGPADGIVGNKLYFIAETTGTVTSFAWSVLPQVNGLDVSPDGRVANFAGQPGIYQLHVSVAGNGGLVAQHVWEFVIVEAPKPDVTAQDFVGPPQQFNVDEFLLKSIAEVQSSNKGGEGQALAGSFRELANLIASGQVPLEADPFIELERACEIAIGPKPFARWSSFFVRLKEVATPAQMAGVLGSPETWSNFLNNTAALLESSAVPMQ